MKKFWISVLLLLLSGAPLTADQSGSVRGQLVVLVSGFADEVGVATITLWIGEEGWLDRTADGSSMLSLQSPVNDGRATFVIDDLPFGQYALTAYHDRNNNGQLDTGVFRIPKERLGFSNGLRPRFKAPTFEDAAFVFKEAHTELAIELTRLP